MAEVIPASGDDWRELMRRASSPEGHVERVLLELQQRLVPVGAAEMAAAAVFAPTPAAAPAGGVTVEELAEVLRDADADSPTSFVDVARYLLNHPRIGPLLRGEGAKRVALAEELPNWILLDGYDGDLIARHVWAAARAEVARQQGEGS